MLRQQPVAHSVDAAEEEEEQERDSRCRDQHQRLLDCEENIDEMMS